MNNENENLTPLSFGNDDALRPIPNVRSEELDDFVPIGGSDKGGSKVINKDSNFVCFFGSASSGKSVILSSLLYYLKARAGVLRPAPETPNTKEANRLLSTFFDNISKGILPERTTRDKVTRLDMVFEPNNKSRKTTPIKLTFLETAGDNNYEIRHGGKFHSSLATYLEADIPLTFIIVTSYENAHREDTFINEFVDELERSRRGVRSVKIIFVISKWDKSGRKNASTDEIDSFFEERLPMTNNMINTYGLTKTYYTIGTVINSNGQEKVTELVLDRAEILTKWLYKSIIGVPLDYEGTFWERIKFSILD